MVLETRDVNVPAWVRYGGIVIILASLLDLFTNFVAVAAFPEAFIPGTQDAVIVGNLILSYLILGIIGVVVLYVYYRESFGWAGKIGLLSIALGAGIGVVVIITTGDIGGGNTGGILNMFLVVFIGAGLLAIGLWRTPSIPRSAALLMAVTPIAAVVSIVGFIQSPEGFLSISGYAILSLAWNGAWIILGHHLWKQ